MRQPVLLGGRVNAQSSAPSMTAEELSQWMPVEQQMVLGVASVVIQKLIDGALWC